MITYDQIRNKEKPVISLTGLTPSEFGTLLPLSGEAGDILISRKIGETERERVCGGDDYKQRKYYSGKKKRHTVKNNLIVSAEGRKIRYLSGTCEGKKHDKKICDEENPVFPKGIILLKDTGFQGYEPEGTETRQPEKKPRGGELSVGEKVGNPLISGVRIVAGHVISGVKRCRIVKDKFRNKKKDYDDIVMEIACGLHNLRTECRQTRN